jgi:hypothetical protein
MGTIRKDSALPEAVEKWGWRYHHMGIPTDIIMPNERYLPHLKFYVSGFSTSPFGIEWMRFEADCPIADIINRFLILRLKLIILRRN